MPETAPIILVPRVQDQSLFCIFMTGDKNHVPKYESFHSVRVNDGRTAEDACKVMQDVIYYHSVIG